MNNIKTHECVNYYNNSNKFCIECTNIVHNKQIDIAKLKSDCKLIGINYDELNKKSKYALETIYKFYDFDTIKEINKKTINDKIYNDLYHKIELFLKNKYGTELEIYLLHLFIKNRIDNIIENITLFLKNNKPTDKFNKFHDGHVSYALSLIKPRLRHLDKKQTCYNLIKKDNSTLLKLSKYDFNNYLITGNKSNCHNNFSI